MNRYQKFFEVKPNPLVKHSLTKKNYVAIRPQKITDLFATLGKGNKAAGLYGFNTIIRPKQGPQHAVLILSNKPIEKKRTKEWVIDELQKIPNWEGTDVDNKIRELEDKFDVFISAMPAQSSGDDKEFANLLAEEIARFFKKKGFSIYTSPVLDENGDQIEEDEDLKITIITKDKLTPNQIDSIAIGESGDIKHKSKEKKEVIEYNKPFAVKLLRKAGYSDKIIKEALKYVRRSKDKKTMQINTEKMTNALKTLLDPKKLTKFIEYLNDVLKDKRILKIEENPEEII